MHHAFHVSLPMKKVGNAMETQPHLPLVVDPSNSIWYPVKIIARKMVKKNQGSRELAGSVAEIL